MTSPFRAALDRIPDGYSEAMFSGRRYRLEKSIHVRGNGGKFYARELGGTDFFSLNLYLLRSGDPLKPCETP